MDFISGTFMAFVAALALVYFLMPGKFQWVVLLIGSYAFYAYANADTLVFLVITSLVTFVAGLALGKKNDKLSRALIRQKDELTREEKKALKLKATKGKRRVVACAVLINLGLLVFLKYYNFLAGNVNAVMGRLGAAGRLPALDLLLPLGISFYTLQSIAYTVDLYRGKYKPDRNFFKFALFMSFFPQIVQGPIARYDQLAHQLYEPHKFDYDRVAQGAQLILWGFMKKLILADRIAVAVDCIFNDPGSYSGFLLFFAASAYGLQVYADFSSGMDIARGVSQILGIDLALNFERPYFSRSISEFWRRWHISLGNWMRDYVFYPLSLSKAFSGLGRATRKIFGTYVGKKLPSFLSMFIVFLLVGIWHGSSWKYLAYGVWNGTIIVTSILLEPAYAAALRKCGIDGESFGWKFIQMFRTFLLSSFGRFFPRAASCTVALDMIKRTFTGLNPWVFFDGSFLELGLTYNDYLVVLLFVAVLLVVGILQERGIHIREAIASQNVIFRWVIYIGAILALMVYGSYGAGYTAGEFIYQQF